MLSRLTRRSSVCLAILQYTYEEPLWVLYPPKFLFAFYPSQMCTEKGYITFGIWMSGQTCLVVLYLCFFFFSQMKFESKNESSIF